MILKNVKEGMGVGKVISTKEGLSRGKVGREGDGSAKKLLLLLYCRNDNQNEDGRDKA